MAFWGNPADTMAIYVPSDKFGLHTSVVTRSKISTTIHSNFKGTANDVLEISSIKLLYMGVNRFGHLWKKAVSDQPSFYGPNFNYQLMLRVMSVPSTDDVETACTLIQIGDSVTPYMQEGTVPSTPLFGGPEVTASDDAMDKIVGRLDVCLWKPLNCNDAMDEIIKNTGNPFVNVETRSDNSTNIRLKVETKKCTVNLVRLDSILLDRPKQNSTSIQSKDSVMPNSTVSRPTSHSSVCPKPSRITRKPRGTSTNVHYEEETEKDIAVEKYRNKTR